MGVSTSLSVDVLVFPIIKFLSKSDTGSRCETGPGTMRLSTFRFLRLSHQNVMIHSHRDRSVFRHFCFWQNHQLDRLVDVKGESMLQPGSSRKNLLQPDTKIYDLQTELQQWTITGCCTEAKILQTKQTTKKRVITIV